MTLGHFFFEVKQKRRVLPDIWLKDGVNRD